MFTCGKNHIDNTPCKLRVYIVIENKLFECVKFDEMPTGVFVLEGVLCRHIIIKYGVFRHFQKIGYSVCRTYVYCGNIDTIIKSMYNHKEKPEICAFKKLVDHNRREKLKKKLIEFIPVSDLVNIVLGLDSAFVNP